MVKFRFSVAVAGALLAACGSSPHPAEQTASVEQGLCDADDPACQQGVAAPRPRWSEQPDRVLPVFNPSGTGGSGSGGQIVACNRDLLGKMPLNPNPKGADLQNVSTNFHVLQSLEILASA